MLEVSEIFWVVTSKRLHAFVALTDFYSHNIIYFNLFLYGILEKTGKSFEIACIVKPALHTIHDFDNRSYWSETLNIGCQNIRRTQQYRLFDGSENLFPTPIYVWILFILSFRKLRSTVLIYNYFLPTIFWKYIFVDEKSNNALESIRNVLMGIKITQIMWYRQIIN
jgi:hypothetical protein